MTRQVDFQIRSRLWRKAALLRLGLLCSTCLKAERGNLEVVGKENRRVGAWAAPRSLSKIFFRSVAPAPALHLKYIFIEQASNEIQRLIRVEPDVDPDAFVNEGSGRNEVAADVLELEESIQCYVTADFGDCLVADQLLGFVELGSCEIIE